MTHRAAPAVKANFKNGTILWLLYLGYLGLLTGLGTMAVRVVPEGAVYVIFGLLLAGVLGTLYLDWVLILQSRYVYTIPQSLRNALLAWLKYPGSTFVYPVSIAIPFLLCMSVQMMPLVAFLGVTLPQMISTTLYSRVFDQMEGVSTQVPEL